MKEMFMKLFHICSFIFVLVFYIIYSSLILEILKKFDINVKNLPITLQTIILILIELSLVFFICFLYRKDLKKEFKIFKNNFLKTFLFSIKWWLLGLVLMALSNIILQLLFHATSNNENQIQKLLGTMPIYVATVSCICAPIIEEMIFRKSLKKCFKSPYLFIVASGLIFGLLHVLTSKNIYEFLYIIPYGLFGSVFAYIYYKTKTIFSTISIHMIHNTILIIISLIGLGVF